MKYVLDKRDEHSKRDLKNMYKPFGPTDTISDTSNTFWIQDMHTDITMIATLEILNEKRSTPKYPGKIPHT
jgi:hypothetical protein